MNKTDYLSILNTGNTVARTIRILITLSEDIDKNVLRHALDRTMKRYSYFAFKIVKGAGPIPDKVENDSPVQIFDSVNVEVGLGSKEANYHWLFLAAEGDELRFEISHSLADGCSCLRFLKTLLYCYYCEKLETSLDATGIILPESEWLPGEDDKPGYIDAPNDLTGRRYVKDAFLLPETQNPDKKLTYFKLRIPERDFLMFGKHNDSSPVALMTVFMYRMLLDEFPDMAQSVFATVAINSRDAVRAENSRHSVALAFPIEHKPAFADFSYEKLGTITRGQIMLQSDDEVIRAVHNATIEAGMKIAKAQDPMEKKAILDELLALVSASTTYSISYVGKSDWGALEPFVKSMYSVVASGDLMLEVNSAGGYFDVAWVQSFESDRYVLAFKRILEKNGISCEATEPIPMLRFWNDLSYLR